MDLDPVDNLAVAAIGPPGQRRFYLQVAGAGQVLTLGCEKVQVQALVERIREALAAQGTEAAAGPPSTAPVEPLEAQWDIAELGVGFHEASERFVIVVREQPGAESEGGVARLWASPDRLRAFAVQAAEVLAGGRPPCPRCGLPMDPAGHPCPMSNGSHPVF